MPFLFINHCFMKNNRLSVLEKVVIFICGLTLFVVLFVPMWQIQLAAPQYPEGLVLLIYPNKLAGNVDIINGLNHYIGMKTMHTADFIEFKMLPYIIGFFSMALLLTGLLGKRKLLYLMFFLFVSFGVVAMIDFWKWEYDYGHNLNPDAAIVVPGMAYQPPLIGFKQLLNFGAYSIPDIGGWLFVGVGVMLFVLVFKSWYQPKKKKIPNRSASLAVLVCLLFSLPSCSTKPEPFQLGKDHCDFCKMTISDPRFGAELITKKGKLFKFDDVHCLLSFLQKNDRAEIKETYFVDFNDHHFIPSKEALFLKSEDLRSPMAGNIAAFLHPDSLQTAMQLYKGSILHWNEILQF